MISVGVNCAQTWYLSDALIDIPNLVKNDVHQKLFFKESQKETGLNKSYQVFSMLRNTI